MGDFAGGLLLARELIPGSTVLCAVSGGADSVCLLHQLYRLRREIPFTWLPPTTTTSYGGGG